MATEETSEEQTITTQIEADKAELAVLETPAIPAAPAVAPTYRQEDGSFR